MLPPASMAADRPPIRVRGRRPRNLALKWLRQTHVWLGLWGACLGLLFGISGVVLNHRGVLELPIDSKMAEQAFVLTVPALTTADDAMLEAWARRQFGLAGAVARWRNAPATPVTWGATPLIQPARRQLTLALPRLAVEVSQWAGSPTLTVKRQDANVWGTLNRLHMGQGLGLGWVLLVDTLAGGLILLSLSGVLLWSRLQPRRLLAAGLGMVAFAGLIAGFALGLL